MGVDVSYNLKCKISAKLGSELAKFCLDWDGTRPLKATPKPPFLATTYEHCRSLFEGFYSDEMIQCLREGDLRIHNTTRWSDEALKVFTVEFLPRALESLDYFFCDFLDTGDRVTYAFDKATQTLVESAGEIPDEQTPTEPYPCETVNDEVHPPLTVKTWPQHWVKFLLLITDVKLFSEVLISKSRKYDFDPPFTDFDDWFGINCYFGYRLKQSLKDGGILPLMSEKERKLFLKFGKAFEKYLPEDDVSGSDAAKVLREEPWQAIRKLAQELLSSDFLKSAEVA